jgi:hypothetical protein
VQPPAHRAQIPDCLWDFWIAANIGDDKCTVVAEPELSAVVLADPQALVEAERGRQRGECHRARPDRSKRG